MQERRDYALIGWLLLTCTAIGMIVLVRREEYLGAAAALFFGLLGGWMALGFGWVELRQEGVRRGCPLGVWEIRWEEVRTVRTDGLTFVLHGPAKHLPLVPSYWRRPQADEGMRLLGLELERRGIPLQRDRRASYRLPWNVRVSQRSGSSAA
jgi:hypothetical protein